MNKLATKLIVPVYMHGTLIAMKHSAERDAPDHFGVLSHPQQRVVQAIYERLNSMDDRLEILVSRSDSIEQRISTIEQRLSKIETATNDNKQTLMQIYNAVQAISDYLSEE